jgi:hypothetical protein
MVANIDICNLALDHLGAEYITSLSEDTPQAIACNQQYDICRRSLLRAHPWNFASKRASLAEDVTTPAFGYDHRFTLPTDCLRVLATEDQLNDNIITNPDFNGYLTVSNALAFPQADNYKIESGFLLSNSGTVSISYIFNQTDVAKFDTTFIDVLALKLAWTICYKVTGNSSRRKDLMEEYKAMLVDAKSSDGQEGTKERVERSSWLSVRGY